MPSTPARISAVLVSTAVAVSSLIVTAPISSAAVGVTIDTPVSSSGQLYAGVPFTISADISGDASTVAFSASGCTFTPASVTNVQAGGSVASSANCPAGTLSKAVTVKATGADGTSSSASATVTFENSGTLTPTLGISRAASPICTGKAAIVVKATTPAGEPIMGLTVSTSASNGVIASGKTNAAGEAVIGATLSGGTLTASGAPIARYSAASSVSIALTPDTCSLKVVFDQEPASSADYLQTVTASGHVYIERDSDKARIPVPSHSVTLKAGPALVGTGTTDSDGAWSITGRALAAGPWTASTKTSLGGVSNTTHTAQGRDLTLSKYTGTLSAIGLGTPPLGYFIAGGSVRGSTTLTTRDPSTNEPNPNVNKGIGLVGSFILAGDTDGMAFGSKLKSGPGGVTRLSGLVGGNGAVVLDVDPSVQGVSDAHATIPVEAQARVRLSMPVKSAPAGSQASVFVTAAPLLEGTALLEYKTTTSETWLPLGTAPINETALVTVPAQAGNYTVRAVTEATSKANAGASKPVSLVVTDPAGETARAMVTDLSCDSIGGDNPTCTWGTPFAAPGVSVTGYVVKAGSLTVATLTDPSARSAVIPSTVTVPETGVSVAAYKTGSPVRVTITPTVSGGTGVTSAPVPVTVLAPPTMPSVTANDVTTVIGWKAPRGVEEGYWVSLDSGPYRPALSTGYVFTGLTDTLHRFSVLARNSTGDLSAPLEFTSNGSGPGSELTFEYPDTEFARNTSGQVLTPSVTGASGPVEFAVTAGTLPNGVELDTDTGALIGPDLGSTSGGFTSSLNGALGAGANGPVKRVHVFSDNSTYAMGQFTSWNGEAVGRFVKLTPSGAVDTAYMANVGTGANGPVNGSVIQTDGKIVLGGSFTSWNGTPVGRAVRLNTDGTLDTAFAAAIGTGFNHEVQAVIRLSATTLIFAGNFTAFNAQEAPGLVRMDTSGVVDATFAAGLGTGAGAGLVNTVAVDANGKTLVGGAFASWNGASISNIVRLNSDGTVDPTFLAMHVGTNGPVTAFRNQSDTKVVVAGHYTAWDGTARAGLARLNSDGSTDTAFNAALGAGGPVNAVAFDSSGRILIAGSFASWAGHASAGVARILPTGAVDTDFTAMAAGGAVNSVQVRGDGLIVTGGAFTVMNGQTVGRVAYLEPAGVNTNGFPATVTIKMVDTETGGAINTTVTLTVAP